MNIPTRKKLLLLAVLILVVLNLWYWWPSATRDSLYSEADLHENIGAADLKTGIIATTEQAGRKNKRNLFYPVVKKKIAKRAKPRKITPAVPVLPKKTKEEVARDNARAELASVKLVGVVFRDGKWQAFLTRGEQTYVATTGDKIGERFTVEKITTDAVYLIDPTTGVTGTISLSGQ